MWALLLRVDHKCVPVKLWSGHSHGGGRWQWPHVGQGSLHHLSTPLQYPRTPWSVLLVLPLTCIMSDIPTCSHTTIWTNVTIFKENLLRKTKLYNFSRFFYLSNPCQIFTVLLQTFLTVHMCPAHIWNNATAIVSFILLLMLLIVLVFKLKHNYQEQSVF